MEKRRTSYPVIFAAMSKRNFFMREHIIKYILEEGYTPTSAFMMYSYFLLDTVERKRLIEANNDLIRISDEVWVFGEISDGVCEEIILAKNLDIPISYFALSNQLNNGIVKISDTERRFESDCKEQLRLQIETL